MTLLHLRKKSFTCSVSIPKRSLIRDPDAPYRIKNSSNFITAERPSPCYVLRLCAKPERPLHRDVVIFTALGKIIPFQLTLRRYLMHNSTPCQRNYRGKISRRVSQEEALLIQSVPPYKQNKGPNAITQSALVGAVKSRRFL